MKKIVINGGRPLKGEVTISGAKNSVVALIPATILAEDIVTLDGVPDISDVASLIEIMTIMGAKIDRNEDSLIIDPRGVKNMPMPFGKINSLRASYYFYGSLLGRYGQATVGLPGGCDLGPRPIDLHLKAFEAMGATMAMDGSSMKLATEGRPLQGANIYMDTVSVGATINTILAAVKAKGRTVIENAAREPEIVDLAILLNEMGAKVKGAGTETITITGVEKLHGTTHNVVQDRIEAGTFMVAAAMTGGDVLIRDAVWEHNRPLIAKLLEMGVEVIEEDEGIRVRSQLENLKAVHVKTLPHPGFPTDMQAQFTALMTVAKGESTMVETVFENRFQHLEEMRRMGLHSEIIRDTARIVGGQALQGAEVLSTDLRASAALILTGLIAQGETVVGKLVHLDRGYYRFHEKLAQLGANIQRIEASDEDE